MFVIRLEDGDVVPDCIEQFAEEKKIALGHVILVGGLSGGEIVVGPRDGKKMPPEPVRHPVEDAHEVSAVGVIAPSEDGKPALHIHGALGRGGRTIAGCLRPGVKTWLVGEMILYEILGAQATRVMDSASNFALLEPKA